MARTRLFKVKHVTARSKVKSRSNYDEAQLHPLTNVPTKYELPTPYGFRDIARTRFFKVKVITARSKVRSRSINVPTKYELPTPYDFRDIAWTRFVRSRSNYDVAHLCPQSMSPTKYQHPTLIVTEI